MSVDWFLLVAIAIIRNICNAYQMNIVWILMSVATVRNICKAYLNNIDRLFLMYIATFRIYFKHFKAYLMNADWFLLMHWRLISCTGVWFPLMHWWLIPSDVLVTESSCPWLYQFIPWHFISEYVHWLLSLCKICLFSNVQFIELMAQKPLETILLIAFEQIKCLTNRTYIPAIYFPVVYHSYSFYNVAQSVFEIKFLFHIKTGCVFFSYVVVIASLSSTSWLSL